MLFIQHGWMPQKKLMVMEMPLSTEWTISKKTEVRVMGLKIHHSTITVPFIDGCIVHA